MQARETTIKDLLVGDKIYVVPRYQRRYAWAQSDWEQLWRAIQRQYDADRSDQASQGHFMGSVVCAQRQSFPTDAPNFDVIDGQQRLTTITLFLAALRSFLPEGSSAAQKARALIANQFEGGDFEFKLRPGDEDRNSVFKVLGGNPDDSTGRPAAAFNYFHSELEKLDAIETLDGEAMLRAATNRLEVVQILTGQGDNAHRIFQTLNSTGKELTAVDLLRNHFFMLLPRLMDAAYAEHWKPMQDRLGEQIQHFLWVDLVTRDGLDSVPNKADRIYAEWQSILDPVSGNEASVMAILGELATRASSYDAILRADTGDIGIDGALARLRGWGSNVHLPLTFAVVERWRRRSADTTRTLGALACIESFLVRRMLAGVATNNLNRIFTTAIGQLAQAHGELDVEIRRILSQPGKYWPDDDALIRDGLNSPFYERQRATQRQFILRRLEELISAPYAPDWTACHFTIEHVLPQTITTWWNDHLLENGESEPSLAHLDLRHTIGNLTLTCENPQLGQMSFAEKCDIYANDIVQMNDDIAELAQWGRSEIQDRGRRLLKTACEAWVEPMPTSELGDHDLAAAARILLQAIPVGRWVRVDMLSEYLEVDVAQMYRALTLLQDVPASDAVLLPSGALRSDQQGADSRSRALDYLMQAGLIENAEQGVVHADLALSAEDLEVLTSG